MTRQKNDCIILNEQVHKNIDWNLGRQMRSFGVKRKKKILILTLSVVLALALTVLGCAIYLGDYYRADRPRIDEYVADIGIEQMELSRGTVAFEPEGAPVGLIFYPGGKVEAEAYIPLMASLAEKGIVTVLVRMPFNLAVLDSGAAEGICEYFPEIERWYIGGHSLGGAMASFYVSSHADEFEGLVLLGAYSTSDISDTELRVLSVYGSEDGVMNRKKYEKYS